GHFVASMAGHTSPARQSSQRHPNPHVHVKKSPREAAPRGLGDKANYCIFFLLPRPKNTNLGDPPQLSPWTTPRPPGRGWRAASPTTTARADSFCRVAQGTLSYSRIRGGHR